MSLDPHSFNFEGFAASIAATFDKLAKNELYTVSLKNPDEVWNTYLKAFPEGTNPIYRIRTYHDGSYDRHFVRRIGNVVAIVDGKIQTIWDVEDLPYPYNEVCAVLDAKLKRAKIESVFRCSEMTFGYISTVERLESGATHRWHHFHANVAARHRTATPAKDIGEISTQIGVFHRGLTEITIDAIDSVLDLIERNALYRGAEFKPALQGFRKLHLQYKALSSERAKNVALWEMFKAPASHTLIKNTVIGTLLVDISEGKDFESAVAAYEQKVAPSNYKRPMALITQKMVDAAAKTLAELGLESALERRFAVLGDVSVNNVLWVNNDVSARMKDGIAGLLAADVTVPAKAAPAADIHIDQFLTEVLPKVSSMEALVSNELQGNLVSLTAPVHAQAARLFKWDNGFAWSYNGNITDSIKERVKKAGGNVDAALRVSLAWFNYDDLDLHSHGPDGHVYFSNRAGILDVDMNAGGGRTRTPVENQSWSYPRAGQYQIVVVQFCKRESTDVGFTLELAAGNNVLQYSYPRSVTKAVACLRFKVDARGEVGDIEVIDKDLVGGRISQEKWGIKTERFIKVNTLLNSPNHWDDQAIGNKHWFFVLDGCVNDEPTRGIYNEFLRQDLKQHRKVFEVLGDRTKCAPTAEQLSGLGFSSTKRDTLTVRVKGKRLNATYNINF